MEPSATSTTVTELIGECLQAALKVHLFSTIRHQRDFMILAPDINIQTYVSSAIYLSGPIKYQRWWMQTAAVYMQTYGPSALVWFESWQSLGTVPFTK